MKCNTFYLLNNVLKTVKHVRFLIFQINFRVEHTLEVVEM